VAAQGGVAVSGAWPDVDVDVKQRFQFGGIGALFGYEIDVLVTPDPLNKPGLRFEPVFDYEQVLVVAERHRLAAGATSSPSSSRRSADHLPGGNRPARHLQPVPAPAGIMPRATRPSRPPTSCCRWSRAGAAWALPKWLAEEYADRMPLAIVKLGKQGIAKQIFWARARRRGARLPELIRRIRARVELAGVATDALMNALTNALIAPASGRVRAGLPSRSRGLSRSRETTAILFISRMLQTRRFVFVSKRLAKCISGEHAGPLSGRHA
jgi:hypothetical protein